MFLQKLKIWSKKHLYFVQLLLKALALSHCPFFGGIWHNQKIDWKCWFYDLTLRFTITNLMCFLTSFLVWGRTNINPFYAQIWKSHPISLWIIRCRGYRIIHHFEQNNFDFVMGSPIRETRRSGTVEPKPLLLQRKCWNAVAGDWPGVVGPGGHSHCSLR